MRLTSLTLLLLGLIVANVIAQEPPVPVDPLIHCRALVELVVKDRANAQQEAAYFATRTHALMEENKQLKAKLDELAKPPVPTPPTEKAAPQ